MSAVTNAQIDEVLTAMPVRLSGTDAGVRASRAFRLDTVDAPVS
ncbi:hypothetical protein [Methylobacterium brachiatum]|jgi:hypothetical protein|nr:hypothetical protein [Methylobacterium brachiatum]MDF2601544.1 hypothetical protein [Methylobacterium brachiatum]MDH2310580.1 hypothetical protein [Methylobacterium brachiatum]